MAKVKKREQILIGLACCLGLAFVFDQLVCSGPPNEPAVSSDADMAVAAAAKPEESISKNRNIPENRKRSQLEQPETYSTWGRDPFSGFYHLTSRQAKADSSDPLTLNGIIWKDGKGLALIGNEILKEGDRMGHLEIVAIKRNQVVCRKGKKLITLFLKNYVQ